VIVDVGGSLTMIGDLVLCFENLQYKILDFFLKNLNFGRNCMTMGIGIVNLQQKFLNLFG